MKIFKLLNTTNVVEKPLNWIRSCTWNSSKFFLFALILIYSSQRPHYVYASTINDQTAFETYSVSLQELEICHQHEWRHLSVKLSFQTDQTLAIEDVRNFIRTYLEEYSNPDDFWEIMNKQLVQSLVSEFPQMNKITSTLSLAPDKTLHFPRESIVHYQKGVEHLKESFNFTKLNYPICQDTFHTLNIHVSWDMKNSPNPETDYPDYQWMDAAMDGFFKETPMSFSDWKTLKPQLKETLLERFPSLETVEIDVSVVD